MVVIGDGMGSVGRYIFRTTLSAFLVVLLGVAAAIWVEFPIDGGLQVARALHDFDPMTSRGQTILAFIAIAALIVRLLVPVIARYAAAQQTHTWARYKPLFMFACLAALCVAMVFHSLTEWFHTDEEVYVTPAYLAQHMRLYADFLYLQTPIYPLVLSKLLMLFSSVSPFLIARLLSAALTIGSVIVFFDLAARLSKSKRVAAILASLFASAPLMLLAYGSARNDIMPIFFGLCGVWFALRGLDAEREQFGSYLALFLAGFWMALAVGAKLTAAFIPLSAMLYIFLRAKRGLLPLILGGAAGSLPIVYYATTAFDKFLFGNATFHLTIYKEFYTDIGMAEFITWPYRVRIMMLTWAAEPALVVAALFIAVVAFTAWRRGPLLDIIRKHLLADRIFIILLMVAAIPFVLLPSSPGKQYLQPAVPYVLLSCAALYPLAQRIVERRQMLFFVNIAVAVLALQAGRFVVEAVQNLNPSLWTVTEVHDLSVLIARHTKKGAVATLYPILALDAGSPIYPQFSLGVFFFRSGNHFAPERVLELNGVSPTTLPHLLSEKPPAAVLIGTLVYDRPLLTWAQRNCYTEVDLLLWRGRPYHDDTWKPRLFVRPDEPDSCQSGWDPLAPRS
jgi:hypothetical protein